jgi:hypothetical protein
MALPDLTGLNIQDSYQRVVHTDGTDYYDGTGSLLNIGGGGGSSFNTATGSYGSFYSTQTQTNIASTARSMSLNITDITNGVSISGSTNPYNTYIKTQNAGVYDIQFSAQVDKTDSGTDEIWIWLKKNGTDVDDSATSVQLTGNGAHYVAAWNFFVNAAANDYFQLMWYSPDANVRLHAEPAFGVVPGIPSLIVTANRVDQFLSNTGSFSGSFTGQFTGSLFGTSSRATSASWAPMRPGGPNTSIQYNFNGTLAGASEFTFNNTNYSLTQGDNTKAVGNFSHAEGKNTLAQGIAAHAEGYFTTASGDYSHAAGNNTVASGSYQSVIGQYNISSSVQSAFIVGSGTSDTARSNLIFAAGSTVQVTGSLRVTGGVTGSLFGTSSFAISSSRAVSSSYALNATNATTATTTSNISSAITNNVDNYLLTATGGGTVNGEPSLTFDGTTLIANSRFQQGNSTSATGDNSHAEGNSTSATGVSSHAEGRGTISYSNYSHTEGLEAKAGITTAFKATVNSGIFNIESGYGDITSIFTIGNTLISDDTAYDNTYGRQLYIISDVSWDGTETRVTITDSSVNTTYSNIGDPNYLFQWKDYNGNQPIYSEYSHAEGTSTVTIGAYSHAEGNSTIAVGNTSHAEGTSTIALGDSQHVQGRFNIPLTTSYSFIHGNGIDNVNRSNLIHAYDSTVEITGSLNVSGSITGSLFGTATNAIQATQADYATSAGSAINADNAGYAANAGSTLFAATASYVNTLNQNVVVTGSLNVTGSTTLKDVLILVSRSTAPAPGVAVTGSIIMSGSLGANLNLYVYTGGNTAAGNGWGKITIT